MSEIEEKGSDVVGGGDGRREDEKRQKEKGTWYEGRQKEKGNGSEGHVEKDKRMALFRFRKFRNKLLRRSKRPSSPLTATRCGLGKWLGGGGGGGGGGCHLCFKPSQTLDSSGGAGSHTSDPNSPEFSYELLKALIEKNDFYSKECNPHLDIDNVPSSGSDK